MHIPRRETRSRDASPSPARERQGQQSQHGDTSNVVPIDGAWHSSEATRRGSSVAPKRPCRGSAAGVCYRPSLADASRSAPGRVMVTHPLMVWDAGSMPAGFRFSRILAGGRWLSPIPSVVTFVPTALPGMSAGVFLHHVLASCSERLVDARTVLCFRPWSDLRRFTARCQ